MQDSESFAEQFTPTEPIEIDPSLWPEVVGGSPKNTWSTIQNLFGSVAELVSADG